jgi:nucleotide-binding universal stress UspA family protein
MRRILVGTDGSPVAGDALRWAANLARVHDAELIVITCRRPPAAGGGEVHEGSDDLEAELASWVEPVTGVAPVLRASMVIDDPRHGILQEADREDADLVVVGRTGHGSRVGPRFLQLNSTAEHLVHHSDRPLAVIAAGSPARLERIVVGYDGSENGRAAARWVRDTALKAGAVVHVVSVWQPLVEWTRTDNPRHWRREHEALVRRRWAGELFDVGLEVELHAIRSTRAAANVLRVAQRCDADLIVVGMRGLGGFSGLRIGGVALRVTHRARRSVVLVPPAA